MPKDTSSSSLFKDLKRTARQAISGDKNPDSSAGDAPGDIAAAHVNGGSDERGSSSQPMSLVVPPVDENDTLHLVPGILCSGRGAFGNGGGGGGEKVVQVACGNQGGERAPEMNVVSVPLCTLLVIIGVMFCG